MSITPPPRIRRRRRRSLADLGTVRSIESIHRILIGKSRSVRQFALEGGINGKSFVCGFYSIVVDATVTRLTRYLGIACHSSG